MSWQNPLVTSRKLILIGKVEVLYASLPSTLWFLFYQSNARNQKIDRNIIVHGTGMSSSSIAHIRGYAGMTIKFLFFTLFATSLSSPSYSHYPLSSDAVFCPWCRPPPRLELRSKGWKHCSQAKGRAVRQDLRGIGMGYADDSLIVWAGEQ